MEMVLFIGLILVAGFTFGKLINYLKLPAVTGYLVAGLFFGPSLLGIVSPELITELTPVNSIALGLIAFLIGGEFSLKQLKQCGKTSVVIAVVQVIGAFLFVTLSLTLLAGVELYKALIFGAISTATAPAATIMVLRQYKAKGPLTENLLAVVAIDDALCLIIFGLCMAVAKVMAGKVSGGLLAMVATPLWEILGSLLLGIIFGWLLLLISSRFKEQEDKLVVTLGLILGLTGLAEALHLSSLLTCMTMGCMVVNLFPQESGRLFALVKSIDTPIYVLFFVLAGANLELAVLQKVGVIGVVFIISRVLGKMLGAWLGAVLSHAPRTVQKYLGLGLIPQAGVAIGLSLMVQQNFAEIAEVVTTVVLGAVVIYEIIGPFFAKLAITKAGEVGAGKDV